VDGNDNWWIGNNIRWDIDPHLCLNAELISKGFATVQILGTHIRRIAAEVGHLGESCRCRRSGGKAQQGGNASND
jgi:hypothetical protein